MNSTSFSEGITVDIGGEVRKLHTLEIERF